MKYKYLILLLSVMFISSLSAQNLLTNGDFESGGVGTGFAVPGVGYVFNPGPPHSGTSVAGNYAFATNPKLVSTAKFLVSADHTPGAGDKMMVIDGTTVPGQPVFWAAGNTGSGICGLTPGQNYLFSYWIQSISTQVIDIATRAVIQVDMTGATNLTLQSGEAMAPLPNPGWVKVTYTFEATASCVTINLSNTNVSATGNDFAIDDLMLYAPPTATISGSVELCNGAPAPEITFTGAGGTPPYTFTYSINGGAPQTTTTTAGSDTYVLAPTNVSGVFTYELLRVSYGSGGIYTNVASGTAVVQVHPAVTISGDITTCPGYPTLLTFKGSPNATVVFESDNSTTHTIVLDETGEGQFITPEIDVTTIYSLVSVATATCTAPVSGYVEITIDEELAGCGFDSPTDPRYTLYAYIQPDQNICKTYNTKATLHALYYKPKATTTYIAEEIDYNPQYRIDYSSNPLDANTRLTIATDDTWSPVQTLPWKFGFYTNPYDRLLVGSNGIISFNLSPANVGGGIPGGIEIAADTPTGPASAANGNSGCAYIIGGQLGYNDNTGNTAIYERNSIFGVNQDLQPLNVVDYDVQNINYYIDGVAPNRVFVVNTVNFPLYQCGTGSDLTSTNLQTYQMILYETSNVIDVNVKKRTPCNSFQAGNGVIGIINQTGTKTLAAPLRDTGNWSASAKAYRFRPNGANMPVSVAWYEGTSTVPFATGDQVEVEPTAEKTMYRLEVTYTNIDGTTSTIKDYFIMEKVPPLTILDPEPVQICSNNTSNFSFPLNQNAYMLNGAVAADHEFTYYTSEENAMIDLSKIPAAQLNNYIVPNLSDLPKTIWVRMTELAGTECTNVRPFVLSLRSTQGQIAYGQPSYCNTVPATAAAIPDADLTPGGIYIASPAGLTIDAATGAIDLFNSDAGTYSIHYHVDAGGSCPEYNTDPVTVIISACVGTIINSRPPVCAGSTLVLTTSDAGTGAIYEWSDVNGVIGTTNVPTITIPAAPATAGSYEYGVKATVGAEVSTISTTNVTVNPIPAATISAPTSVCAGVDAILTFTGTPNAVVMFNDGTAPDQPVTIEPDGSTELSIPITATTTFTIVSVAGNTTPDCIQTITSGAPGSSVVVNYINPDANISSVTPAVLCVNNTSVVNIQGTPGTESVDITISNGSGVLSVNVPLDAAGVGSYTTAALGSDTVVTLVNAIAGACSKPINDTSNITVNPMPSLTAFTASPNPVCSGSDVTLSFTGTQGATLSFSSSADGGTTLVPVLIDATGTGTALISNVTASVTFSIADLTSSDNCQVTTGFPADVTVTISELPLITDEPDNQGLCPGATEVEFTVAANGTNVEYSWYGPAGLISGADQPTLTINNPTVADVGDYYVIASNSCASDTSAIATLSISQPIVITSASAGETVCEGSSRDLEVTVTGDASMTYQWYVNGTTQVNNDSALMISGATTPTLTLGNITPAQAGSYTLVINNTCGQPVTSSPIVYIVDTKPAITVSPVPDNECSGGTVRLNVVATGTNVTYEWFKSPSTTALVNGGRISGADTDNLEIYPADPSDAGLYYVVVSGDCAPPVQSTPVQVDVPLAPSIAAQPVSQQKCAGENLTLSAGAPVDPSFTYQWFVNGTTALTDGSGITGAMTAQLEINPVSASHAGNYTVVVTSGSCPTFTSDIAIITVNEPPVITLQPTDVNQCEGTDFTISVVATGTAVEYQWYRGTTALVDNVDGVTGAQTAMLEISPSDDTIHTGLYHVVVTGTGACSGISVTSANAQVIIREAPSLAAAAADQAICEGESFTLTATPTPGTSFTYQWQFEGNDLSDIPGEVSGSETPVLTVTGATPGREGLYTLAVGNGTCDDFESIPTTVIVNEAPVVVDTPDSQVVCVGNTFSLSTVVTGDVATYKWYFNGEPMTDDLDGRISGSDTSSLTIMNTTPADQGSYYAVIASACPDRTSGVAMITMVDLPVATISYNGPDLCEDSANEVIFTGTGGAIVTYTVNGGDERTITLNPGGTAILLTGLLDETTVYQLLQVELNNCPVDLTTAPGSTATVTVNRLPDIRLDQDGYICTDAVTGVVMQTYTLDTELDAADYTFQWSFEGVQIPGATLPSYAAGQVGRYSVAVTSLSAGCTQSATADITSSSPPISVSATSLSTYFDEDATIVVTVNPPGEYEYRLDEGPYQSSNTFRNVSTLSTTSQSGTHTVWARDLKACGEAPFMITLIDYPKYFTPNGDGYHDTWNISALSNQPDARIMIYDRFGKLLKQISTTGAGWDGTYNGSPLMADDYWFTIKYTEAGMPREFKAHFAMKR